MRMKESGVREDDPEYLKAYNFLTAVSQQSQAKKLKLQQEAIRQQQQQQQRQAQQSHQSANLSNAQPSINGTKQPGQMSINIMYC